MNRFSLLFSCIAAAIAVALPLTSSAQVINVDGINYERTSMAWTTAEIVESPEATGDIVIPEKVTLEGVQFSVTSIKASAFTGSSITSVKLTTRVCTNLPLSAFSGCPLLKNIEFPEGTDFRFNGNSVTNTEGSQLLLILGSVEEFTIAPEIKHIADCAGENADRLKKIEIPANVTLGKSVFSACDSLSDVTIQPGITVLPEYAFASCPMLTSFTVPEGVDSLGTMCFGDCENLSEIKIPASVTKLANSAFAFCNALTEIPVMEGVDSLGYCMFYGCNGFVDLVFPANITKIGTGAFYACEELTRVELHDGIQSIDHMAFQACPELERIVCRSTTPPALVESALDSDQYAVMTLYVPAEAVEAYRQADGWKNFAKITGEAEAGIADIELSSTEAPRYYTITGIKVANPSAPGLYIVRQGKKSSKIIL